MEKQGSHQKDAGKTEEISRHFKVQLPKFKLPKSSTDAVSAYQRIKDQLMLDKNPRLNLATFVTTWTEPECTKLSQESLMKNYVDIPAYTVISEFQQACVNIIANLYNLPLNEGENATGVATIGSSEACTLAGLAFKKKWQNMRREQGKPADKPNLVIGSNMQICWSKISSYLEIELKTLNMKENNFGTDPHEAVELVDENTICVCAMFGNTLNGELDNIKLLNDLLLKRNKERGLNVGIHVDAASAGFVAPFIYPENEWDFRLELVKSINVSGHKYGLVYPGIGWQIWRSKEDLPQELVFHINYLGAETPTFTINFSRGSSPIVAQYYNFLRLGYEGYRDIILHCRSNADFLAEELKNTGRFKIFSKEIEVPVVTFSLNDRSKYDEYRISDELQKYGWLVPAYTLPPDAQNVCVLRAVVGQDFNRDLAE